MLVSHSCKFILFPDPLGACPWLQRSLQPWLDQHVAADMGGCGDIQLFKAMTPAEAELAFDMSGYAFRSYTRVAIVRNPFAKMAHLYGRIAATDRIWQMRRRVGVGVPDFSRWLRSTRPNGPGAGLRVGPTWRRFGAWSLDAWCGDHITHVARAETAEDDLTQIFRSIGITPAFGGRPGDAVSMQPTDQDYDAQSSALIRQRYASDLQHYRSEPDLRLVA